jgi:hypothetical protein
VSQGISPVTTVLPVRPMEIEVVPNPDILNIENISNLIDKGVQTMPAENTVIITEMIPLFPNSLNSGIIPTVDITTRVIEHSAYLATYADRAEALADMLGAFM